MTDHRNQPSRKVREAVIIRDEGRCVVTGQLVVDPDTMRHLSQYSLQHRRARGMGGSRDTVTNSAVNLILVEGTGTTGAHGRIECHRDWARRMGYAVSHWADPTSVPVKHHRHGWAWITPTGYHPLTQSELWLQAGTWLVDELRLRGIDDTDVEGVTRLSTAAAELFGVLAADVRRAA